MASNPQNPGGKNSNAAAAAAAAATGAMRSGIRAVVNDAEAANGALLSMGLAMATGASKAQVALAGLREFLVGRLLGPMANLGGVALGATTSILRMGRALAEAGRGGAAAIEKLEKSFRVLLGGAELAKRRVEELVKFAKDTPFEMRGVVEANRQLQVLTKGALAGKAGMQLVGDAAAVAGKDFEMVAFQVGRLYDGLQNGTPVGEAAFRLQEMGLLSGAARAQIEALQAAGTDGNAVWAVAEADLRRYAGGMKEVSKTLEALERQLGDAEDIAKSTFAAGYMDGMKAGTEAQAKALENLLPLLGYMGSYMGEISGRWDRFKAAVLNATVGSEAFQKVSVPLFQALATGVTAVTTATGAFALLRGAQLLGAAAAGAFGSAQAGAAASSLAAAAAARSAAVATAGGGLAGQVAGIKAWHAAVVAGSAAGGKFSVSAYAMSAASGVLAGAWALLRGAVVGLGRAFLALGPVGWLVTGLAAVVAAAGHLAKSMKDAREATRAFTAAQEEAVAALNKEALAARTAADAQKVRARGLREMVEVLEEIRTAEEELARKKEAGTLWDQAKAKAEEYGVKLENLAYGLPGLWIEGTKAVQKFGPEAADFLVDQWQGGLKETEAQLTALRARAEGTQRVLAAVGKMQPIFDMTETQKAADVAEALSPALGAETGTLAGQLENLKPGGSGAQERRRVEAELARVDADLLDAQNRGDEAAQERLRAERLGIQGGSTDEGMRLKAQMEAINRRVELERAALTEEQFGPAPKQREALARAGGVVGAKEAEDYNAAAVALERLNRLTAEQVALKLKGQQEANKDTAVAAEGQVLGLKDESLARELAMLDIEEEKLNLALERRQISEAQFGAEMQVINAQRENAQRLAARRREAVVAAVQEARLLREAAAARRGGNLAEGDRLEAAGNAIGDNQMLKEEQLRLLAAGFDEITAAAMAQEAVADRVAEREERRATAVRRTVEGLRMSEAALRGNLTALEAMVRAQREAALVAEGMSAAQAKAAVARESQLKGEKGLEDLRVQSLRTVAGTLRGRGDQQGAEKYDKRADRIEEKNRAAELIGEGLTEKVARRIARGERNMAELGREGAGGSGMRFGGQVAVNSLVRVGGGTGPNVAGPMDLARKSNRLLEKIEQNTREPKVERGFGGVSLTSY